MIQIRDALLNMLGAFDTPFRRMKFPGRFQDEAIQTARDAIKATEAAEIVLFVLMKDGKPFELSEADAEIFAGLTGHGFFEFAFASSDRKNVEASREVIQNVLERFGAALVDNQADVDCKLEEFEIAEFVYKA